jgi:arylsulfatase A-like enzyme
MSYTDMGSSAWKNDNDIPLPLLHNETIVEQPVNLGTLTQRYTSYCQDFISRNRDTNFFLYMAFNHVHQPSFVSKEFCNSSVRGRYGDAASEMDNAIGQILKSLTNSGLDNNTIVFFTSDNGPALSSNAKGGSAGLFYGGKTLTWEGGVREPGIVRWNGHIEPGRISHEVVTTYDIFSTVLKLAGVEEPSDRIIDGRDMSPVLFTKNDKSSHDCLYIYKGTSDSKLTGLWAVRCGAYKAHFVTSTHFNKTPVVHDPPLLYQLEYDPSEKYPVDSKSPEYKGAMETIQAAKAIHEATLKSVPNQMAMGGNDEYK